MRLKMLVGLSGPEYSLSPDDERDFPEAEALRLIAAGFAAAVEIDDDDSDDDEPKRQVRKGRSRKAD